jgi:hypothetical protein
VSSLGTLVDVVAYLGLGKRTPLTCFATDYICVRLERILVFCIESLHLVALGESFL